MTIRSHPALAAPAARGSSSPSRGFWVLVAVCGWGALFAVTLGLNRLERKIASAAVPLLGDALPLLVIVATGLLATPLAVVLCLRIRAHLARPLARVVGYSGVGIVFWLSGAGAYSIISQAGLLPLAPHPDGLLAEFIVRAAAFSFLHLLAFAGIMGVLEATAQQEQARAEADRTALHRADLARARTTALAAQLDPHFLFNTIHVASGLMRRDPGAARAILQDLGEILKETASVEERELVPLAEELRLVKRYLRIHRFRFGERLQTSVEMEDGLGAVLVPPLLLQPLVENAVIHGIGTQRQGGKVSISIRQESRAGVRAAGKDGGQNSVSAPRLGRIHVVVANTGLDHPPGQPVVRERIGIGGVRARLSLRFGSAASLSFLQTRGGVFEAHLRLPATADAG